MPSLPLVSVIALSHNHALFLSEALDSVLAQDYPAASVELIIVDDASADDSAAVITAWAARNGVPQSRLILIPPGESRGACAAFNRGLALSRGEFIIDLATDDILLPTRLREQVAAFAALPPTVGVVYTDAELMDEAGRFVRCHYRRTADGQTLPPTLSGDVFAHVLGHYFISTPTMMIRRRVLNELGGYDETLAYEDFDFWVRSSRRWQYHFLDRVLTRKRLHPRSHSRGFYQSGDPQLASTIAVCYKAQALCRTPAEAAALVRRVKYELRQAARFRQWREARQLYELWQQLQPSPGLLWRAVGAWSRWRT